MGGGMRARWTRSASTSNVNVNISEAHDNVNANLFSGSFYVYEGSHAAGTRPQKNIAFNSSFQDEPSYRY